MTHNMGSADRLIRALLVAPAATVAAGLIGATDVAGLLLLGLGVIMLATAGSGFCPLYSLLGISTCRATTRRTGPA